MIHAHFSKIAPRALLAIAIVIVVIPSLPSAAMTDTSVLLLHKNEIMKRPPDLDAPNVRVWTIRRTDTSRTNLVEMKGKLAFHKHPDADHTLMVLEGRVCAWYGSGEAAELGPGDYISIPKDVPHKYATITPTALLLSFDAPAYDPAKTVPVSEEGVEFEPCPAGT